MGATEGGDERESGYYRHPAVDGDRVVFVSEDDLWEVPIGGGRARRLTTGRGRMSHPHFSPDGSTIAFTGTEEGATEVFSMDAQGGGVEQLTYNGSAAHVVGWDRDGESILFRSNFREPFARTKKLYAVAPTGGEVRKLGLGDAHDIDFEPGGSGRVLARHADDIARWKRYRGGTAGALWIDPEGDGDWRELLADEDAGKVRPMWIGGRIYFVSDLEGYGNLYSCDPDGEELTRHTDHEGFYVRFAHTDGRHVVYACGGDLYRYDVEREESEQIRVEYHSSRTPLNRKFVDASNYLEDYALHPEGHSLAISARGKLFNFGNWEGAVRQSGERHGVRYRLPRYLDGDRILCVSDEEREPGLEVHETEGGVTSEALELEGDDLGRPVAMELGPERESLAVATHRHELVHVDLEEGESRVLDRSDQIPISGLDWSPDGRWIAYDCHTGRRNAEIRLADTTTGEIHRVTSGQFRDVDPVFDPKGRYLYFLSCREFNPVYDKVFFDLGFPRAMKPCVVTLRSDEDSPFFEEPRPLEGTGAPSDDETQKAEETDEESEEADSDETDSDGDEAGEIEIDVEGIASRVETFPVREGEYHELGATEDRVFWTVYPVEGALGGHWSDEEPGKGKLEYFSLEDREKELFAKKVGSFRIGPDGKTMALRSRGRLRVVNAGGRGPAKNSGGSDRPSRDSGWIDLGRVPVAVEPRREWEQMLHEAWRLMRDHYWREDMAGTDWDEVWERYSGLLDRVSTRTEFSDLVWIMQGELGTSHAYEMGGDYDRPPQYRPGFLGGDFAWDEDFEYQSGDETKRGAYRIERVVRGDNWERGASSPLDRPGLEVEKGDAIVAVNGEPVDGETSLQQLLVHRAGDPVDVAIASPGEEAETVTVDLLGSENRARYREWVEQNRERVHAATDGDIGYIHIPDMGPRGYAEFYRSYVAEESREGLIVDVRYNGGGHVSELILEKLARRRLGYSVSRWRDKLPYPEGTKEGPTVALTNEYAGSDGDIFSHCFKLMGLGPLLGRRTWGGVVGIWPRHRLVDGSVTTQPEFAFWFEDVGYELENYGTEPDERVEIPPGTERDDPQLAAAIEKVEELSETTEVPEPESDSPPMMPPPDGLD